MASEDGYIRARFWVSKAHVTIYTQYKGINATFRWKRDPDTDLTHRQIKTLITHLPGLVEEGLREVVVQSEIKDLDGEWAAWDEPPAQEEPSE